MRTDELNYDLPPELIAQHPSHVRGESRLLFIERSSGRLIDSQFSQIDEFLSAGDCLVLNDTKVINARFFARRRTGGKLEGLFLNEKDTGLWEILLKGAGKINIGEVIFFKDNHRKDTFCSAKVVSKNDKGKCALKLNTEAQVEIILDKIGFPPLPPYIKRSDDPHIAEFDKLRYQTVYARSSGAVAAPTAGLHFTEQLIENLQKKGVQLAYVTLHVGAGTFKPVSTEMLEEHSMHEEVYNIDSQNANIINKCKKRKGRVVAVGTTSSRVLETASSDSRIKANSGTTALFIKPGYKFQIVDALITNFHLPRSTLLALVAAFAGLDKTLAAYKHAIEHRYRFYSYGDAVLIV